MRELFGMASTPRARRQVYGRRGEPSGRDLERTVPGRSHSRLSIAADRQREPGSRAQGKTAD